MEGEETAPVSVTVETGAETSEAETARAAAEAAQLAAQGAVAAAATVAAIAEGEAAAAALEAEESVKEIERANEEWHDRVRMLEASLAETQETLTQTLTAMETMAVKMEALLTPPPLPETETAIVETATEPESLPSESADDHPEAETSQNPVAQKKRRWI